MLVDPIDDRPHRHDSEQWIEQWQFDFWSPNHDLGGWIHFIHDPSLRRGWYVAALVGVDRPMVLVVDPELHITDLSPYIEFRAEGIWAQHVCETPLRHWTIGLEAFGVTLDDPSDAVGNQWGKRTGVGLDVEWESNSDPQKIRDGFTQECVVTGEVLMDQETIDLNTKGNRCRRWGREPDESENEPGVLAMPIQVGDYVLEIELDHSLGQWQGRLRT